MKKNLFSVFILCGLFSNLTACGHMAANDKIQLLPENIEAFHNNIRWRRCKEASVFVSPPIRADFFDRCEDLAERLGIQDIRISNITMSDDKKEATVNVRLSYYLLPDSVVDKHKAKLKWIKGHDLWFIDKASGAFFKELWPVTSPQVSTEQKQE